MNTCDETSFETTVCLVVLCCTAHAKYNLISWFGYKYITRMMCNGLSRGIEGPVANSQPPPFFYRISPDQTGTTLTMGLSLPLPPKANQQPITNSWDEKSGPVTSNWGSLCGYIHAPGFPMGSGWGHGPMFLLNAFFWLLLSSLPYIIHLRALLQ